MHFTMLSTIMTILSTSSVAFAFTSTTRHAFASSRSKLHSAKAALSVVTGVSSSYNGGGFVSAASTSLPSRSFRSSTFLKSTEGSDEDDKTPFTTWTFDDACMTMEINSLADATLAISDETSLEDSDLLIVGIMAPPKDDTDDEEEEDDAKEEDTPEPTLSGMAKELDDAYGGALAEIMKENYKAFKNGAKAGASTPTARLFSADSKAKKVILVGLGTEGKEDDAEGLMRKIGTTLATKCDAEKQVSKCSLILPSAFSLESQVSSIPDMSSAFYSTLYSDNRYRTKGKIKEKAKDLKSVSIIVEGGVDEGKVFDALESGKKLAKGISLSKDIVNAPHNILNSESLANVARQIAEESGGTIKCTILGKEECEARGMGAYLGVARGSETDPQFIHLTYSPKEGKASKKIGIIGKGLLFDTGGYNIKTAMMELMKFDCGGAAAVLGAARAVGEIAPDDVEAHFLVAACENMINAKAMVPSDVLTASNGKTIEVVNTDAEGRLTLADALVYADKEIGCESIIELSTLTGACMVSLGKKICGVWTSNDDLAEELAEVSKVTGDKSWRMPLEKEYNDQLESKIADISNCGTRYGGAITAALFLQNFVSKKKPFAHIDIAGPVWSDKDGATGFGSKLVTEWVVRQSKKSE